MRIYAWFANNNQVTADGLKISAQTEGTLLIIADNQYFTANGTSSGTAMKETSHAFGMNSGAKLFPTHANVGTISSSYKGELAGWKHATSDSYSTAISNSAESDLTLNAGDDTKNVYGSTTVKQDTTQKYDSDGKMYYLVDDLYIKVDQTGVTSSTPNGYNHLYVSNVSITADATATENLANSARVLMVVTREGESSETVVGSYVFANGKVYSKDDLTTTDGVGTANFGLTNISTTNDGTTTYAVDLGAVNDKYTHVQFYVYFDGRDADCKSSNYDAGDVSVALGFTGV